MSKRHERKIIRVRSEADSSAKDVAGKAIGKHGLLYITIIVVIGVGASVFLEESKIAAVIGLLSAALTALISMLAGIADAEQNRELEIIQALIDKMEREKLSVDVTGDRVAVTNGTGIVTSDRAENNKK